MGRDLDGLSDEDLLARFSAGEEDCFGELVARHEDRLFALALRMTRDRADALDAVQDAFVRAFTRAGDFRGDASFGTWLYRIAVNACHDVLRTRRRAPVPDDEAAAAAVDAVGIPGPENRAVARLDVREALAELPDTYREAVVLHDLGGVPYDDIATATGVSIGTVKSRISRGRRRLRDLLEPGRASPTSKELE